MIGRRAFIRNSVIAGMGLALPQVTGCGELGSLQKSLYIDIDTDPYGYSFLAKIWEPSDDPAHPEILWRLYYDQPLFDAWAPEVIQDAKNRGYTIQVRYGDSISNNLDQVIPMNTTMSSSAEDIGQLQQKLVLRFGNYVLTADCVDAIKNPYVPGCVMRQSPKCSIRINRINPGGSVFDLHLARWKNELGQTCYGLYESRLNIINYCTCNKFSKQWVQETVYSALLRIGVAGTIALTIAGVIASFAEASVLVLAAV